MTRKTLSDAAASLTGTTANEPSEPSGPSKRRKIAPGLYLVATPIGNLRDITLRALEVLSATDRIACEDSRVTRKLLAAHGLSRPLVSYHEHNAEKVRPRLIQALQDGQSVALVSDAGTPLVSDPGYKLVRAAHAAGLPVTSVPGASAALAALTLSGLPSDRVLFAGFLPAKAGPRQKALGELAEVGATLVFFESPRRLAASLAAMADVLGDRPAALARELTKRFEEVRHGSLSALAAGIAAEGPPKGEVTLVVAGASRDAESSAEDLDSRLTAALDGASLRDAVDRDAAATGLPRRRVYRRALELRETGGAAGTEHDRE
jgi:16S rRNA (cytidine1402-2'-O)-methyltransferase